MFTDIIWRFLILQTFVLGAVCCICPYVHPQRHFCRSQFVLRVKIQKEIKVIGAKAFRMQIKELFKGDIRELNLKRNRYVTLLMHPDCPVVSMKTRDEYLIFGENNDNKDGNIYTIDCYGNIPWKKTTRFHKQALAKSSYGKNCNCSPKTKDTTRHRRCKSKYSFMRKSGKHCKWIETIPFQRCVKGFSVYTD